MDNEIISEEISSEFVEQRSDEQPVDVQTEPPPEVPSAEIEPETIIIYVSDSDSDAEEADTQLETEEIFESSETTSDYLKEIYANTEVISEGVSYIFAIVVVAAVAMMCNFILKIFFNNDR